MSADSGTLLVVDDDAINRLLLLRRLGQQGYAVQPVANGKEALELLEKGGIDLVLLDVMMPDMSGLDVLRAIREKHAPVELPVIMVTALHESADIVTALDLGANDYVVKPIDIPVALARIRTQLALRNVTRQLQQANAILARYSYVDGLTGIANRRRFDEYLSQEWRRAARDARPLALILGDVDHFKRYNDTHGHGPGDQVLRRIARALEGTVHRAGDLVARYGGEEFAIVLPGAGAPEASLVAESLRAAVDALGIPHPASSVADHVTITLGVATAVPRSDADPSELIARADQALYEGKHAGRNRVGVLQ